VSLKGGELLVGRGEKTFLKEPHPDKPSWYSPDYFLRASHPWFTHETTEVVAELPKSAKTELKVGGLSSFKAMFEDMKLTKGVVYTSATCENFDWKSVIAHLCESARHLYLYGTEGIIGATPELLFDMESDRVVSMALAATALDPATLKQDKEQEEHALVVTGMKESLEKLGRVCSLPQETLSYGKLYHLLTPLILEEKFPLNHFEKVVAALHPTPALGAYPRQEGSAWLQKWGEKIPRYKFGAPFGYLFPERKEARAFVAIRCVQWTDKQAHLWAGAGVTAKSSYESEYAEIQHKILNTARLMGHTGIPVKKIQR